MINDAKTQHTAGPWRHVESDTLKDFWSIESLDAEGLRLADIVYVSLPNAEANARLIAAAPELLEALKAALYCLETVAKNEGYDTEVGVVPQARAAIAKAEGRDS